MMKYEFEELAGYEVSDDDYFNIIEPMYMACNLDKVDFVKVIDKKRFALKPKAQYLKEIKAIAQHLIDTFDKYTDCEAKDKLQALADEYVKRFYGDNYYAYVNEEQKWSCYYPTSIEFISRDNYKSVGTIAFAK